MLEVVPLLRELFQKLQHYLVVGYQRAAPACRTSRYKVGVTPCNPLFKTLVYRAP